MNKLFMALALGLFAVTTTASAGTETYSDSVSFTSSGASQVQTITLSAFDTQGGTLILDSVVITLSQEASISLGADNDNLTSATVTAELETEWDITGDGNVSGSYEKEVPGTSPIVLSADDGDASTFSTTGSDYAAIQGLGYTLEIVDVITIDSAYMSDFIDTGDVSYEITPEDLGVKFDGISSGLQMEIFDANLDVTVAVAYTYHTESDVPEPAGAALFALAAVGVLFMRKRSV